MKLIGRVVWSWLLQVVLHPMEMCASSDVNCSENPLGMESTLIPDAAISASTSDSLHPEHDARLHHASAGWKPRSYDADPWIQVFFAGPAWLTGLSTQAAGSPAPPPPPEGTPFDLQLLVRGDAVAWIRYQRVLSANYTDAGEIVNFDFEQSLRVTQVRFVIERNPLIGLRMELYGCYEEPNTECAADADCNKTSICDNGHCACAVTLSAVLSNRLLPCMECWFPLGLESGEIPDCQISASTSRSTGPHINARIGNSGAWSPLDTDQAPWLMVQFNQTTRVTGMSTQGELINIFGFPNRDFIRTATVDYGDLATNFTIQENGEPKVFTLNSDEQEIVTNFFPYPVKTDFIKIVAVSPQASDIGLRLELLGCSLQGGVPGTCAVDSDCRQDPIYYCVEQSCVPVNTTTERWSTLATTSAQPTTVMSPTTEQTTIGPTTMTETQTTTVAMSTTEQPTTADEPTTEAPTTEAPTTSEPTTVVPSTDAPTTVQPTTAVPTTSNTTTLAETTTVTPKPTNKPTTVATTTSEPTTAVPSTNIPTTVSLTTSNQPTTTEPLTTMVPTTTRYTTLSTASSTEISTLYSTGAPPVCSATESPFTEEVNSETSSGQSQEFWDALRLEADSEGLSEEETGFLCNAISGNNGGISPGVSEVGLKVLLKVTANRTESIPSTDLVASIYFLDSVANSDWNSSDAGSTQDTLEKMVKIGSNLLDTANEESWKETKVSKQVSGPIQIIYSMEKMALKAGTKLDKESSVEVISENIDLSLNDISLDQLLLSGWNWTSSDAKFDASIAAQEFQKKDFSAYERALLIGGVFRNIAVLSPSDIPDDDDMATMPQKGQRLQSDIVTVMVSSNDKISMSVSYSTPKDVGDVVIHKHERPQFTCVFWEFNESSSTQGSGRWSDFGCYTVESDEEKGDGVSCFCNHTTNFAVLMQVVDKPVTSEPDDIHANILLILTYTCSSISIVSLAIALLVFFYLGSSLASERLTIHKNLMLALLVAMVLFLLGVASNLDVIPCKIVAIVLHYLFLAVFCWILVEGVHLYRQVIAVFEQGESKMPLYYVVGWGVPALVVGVSVGIKYNLYGTGTHCWLTAEDGLIWAFVGPVILIITVNMMVLVMVVVVVTRAAALKCQTNLDRIRAACKSALMLVPLLGISWIIGLFTQFSIVLEYAFVILNGLQGFFMFVFYCLLNSEVRTALRHEMKKRADRNMDSSGNVGKTNVWTLSTNKTTHIRLVKVAPSTHNSDDA